MQGYKWFVVSGIFLVAACGEVSKDGDAGSPDQKVAVDQAADKQEAAPDKKTGPDLKTSPDLLAPDHGLPPDQSAPDQKLASDSGGSCSHPKVTKKCASIASLGLTFCEIPSGCFKMGSPKTEACRNINESQHQVKLTQKLEMQSTEVTQDQFFAMLGYRPSTFKACGGNCPVDTVNWHEAAAYCNALSAKRGLKNCYSCTGLGANVVCASTTATAGKGIYSCGGYRLPTEAEWEYAYRAGTTTAYYSGVNKPGLCSSCAAKDPGADGIGWYCHNSKAIYTGCEDISKYGGPKCAGPHATGQKKENPWGLHDMQGNMLEWCHDGYLKDLGAAAVVDPFGSPASKYRVLRGGSWRSAPAYIRAAYRHSYQPVQRYGYTGFRCARTLP